MNMAKKVLGNEGDANIEGLISNLKKTSPGTLAAIKDGGGRILGKPTADDRSGAQVDPNSARMMNPKKVC